MPLEKDIEKKFVDAVKRDFAAKVVKFKDGAQVGAPDRMILLPNGKVVFVEMKKPGGRLRKPQERYIQQLLNMGFPVSVCDNWIDAYKFVRREYEEIS